MDSPLLAYFKPQSDEDHALQGADLKERFYDFLVQHHGESSQVIIIENQHPRVDIEDKVSMTARPQLLWRSSVATPKPEQLAFLMHRGYFLLSGNKPGIQREASSAAKLSLNGGRLESETTTLCAMRAATTRRAWRSL